MYRQFLSVTLAFLVTMLLAPAAGRESIPSVDDAVKPTATPVFDAAGAHDGGITLRLAALGRGDALASLDPVTPVDDGTRVAYRHGEVTEWYLRQGGGIEQGVTLAARPAGKGPLVLHVATPDADGTGAMLLLPAAGRTTGWRYRDLHVTDATGQAVASHLEAAAGGLAIVVADVGAAYPLVVDPFVKQQTLSDPAATNDDNFGSAVAMSSDGSTLLVGAPHASNYQGKAYIYTKSGGFYGAPTTLSDPAATNDDDFGTAVTVSGDGSTLLVAASGTSSSEGTAYVYTKSGGSFSATPTQTFTDPAATNNDTFGNAVAISGDGSTLLVGAQSTSTLRGKAYIYPKSGSSYGAPITLTDPAATSNDFFGGALTMSGDGSTLLVAAAGTNNNRGTAYVYTKSGGSFATTPTQTLTEPGATNGDTFGGVVAISGDGSTLLVGAFGANGFQGTAYVYGLPPVATNHQYTIARDTPLVVAAPTGLLAGATLGSPPTTITMHTAPSHGSVTINATGSFTYTPTSGYSGMDSFTYTLSNGAGMSTGTVTLTVVNGTIAPQPARGASGSMNVSTPQPKPMGHGNGMMGGNPPLAQPPRH